MISGIRLGTQTESRTAYDLLIERALKSALPREDEPYILAWCETFPDEELPGFYG